MERFLGGITLRLESSAKASIDYDGLCSLAFLRPMPTALKLPLKRAGHTQCEYVPQQLT